MLRNRPISTVYFMTPSFYVQDCGFWSKPLDHSELVRSSTTCQQLSQVVLVTIPMYTAELNNIKVLNHQAQ